MMKSSGIYQIRNTVNGKTYVGSATSLRRRWYEHCSRLQRGVHDNRYLQRAWTKHGRGAFVFEPLFVCARDMLLFYEQRAINAMEPEYNLSPTAGNTLGVKHTAETRARMSAANKGKKLSPEHAAKIATSNRGQKRTEETKAKMVAAATGRVHSYDTKAKIAVLRTGTSATPESKEKASAALRGRPKSEAHRANMLLAWQRRKGLL